MVAEIRLATGRLRKRTNRIPRHILEPLENGGRKLSSLFDPGCNQRSGSNIPDREMRFDCYVGTLIPTAFFLNDNTSLGKDEARLRDSIKFLDDSTLRDT